MFRKMTAVAALLLCGAAYAAETSKMPDTVDAATPKAVQIELALSAAPRSVSNNATIYVFGKKGYRIAREGTNGFHCLISRERLDTLEPECFDAETGATSMQTVLFREVERAKGRGDDEINAEIAAGYETGRFKAPAKPGIIYMTSPHNRVFDPERGQVIPFPGHYMFPAPYMTYKDLGASAGEGLPYLVDEGKPTALIIVVPSH
jgi:hypothetical protein